MEQSQIVKQKKKRRRMRANGDGYVYRRGRFWFVRFHDWRLAERCVHCGGKNEKHASDHVYEPGEPKQERVQMAQKLCRIEKGYRSKVPPDDVLQMAQERLAPVKATAGNPQATLLLEDFIEQTYLPDAQKKIRPSTYYAYCDRWHRLKPWLKDEQGDPLRLRSTETADVQYVLDRIASGTQLRSTSIAKLKHLLSGAFALAIRSKGVMPKGFGNPVREARLPATKAAKKETHAYSLEEVRQMLAIVPEPARTALAVAAFTGLRRGEIRGLRWQDYGEAVFDDGQKGLVLHVTQSVWNGIATAPKTEQSSGYVPVIPLLKRLLDEHRARAGFSLDRPATGPIFPNEASQPRDLNTLLFRHVMPAIRKCAKCHKRQNDHEKADHVFEEDKTASPRWHGWHAFRRGLATNLHRLGVPDKVIQRILRHANANITREAYIKTVDSDAAAWMTRFGEKIDEGSFLQ